MDGENVVISASMDNRQILLKELKFELTYDSAIPFLRKFPKNIKTLSHKRMHTNVHCSTLQANNGHNPNVQR